MSDPNQNSIDPQQLTQQIAASYVDDYMPPVTPAAQPAVQPQPPQPPQPATPQPVVPPMPPMVEPPAPLMPIEEAMPPMIFPPEPKQPEEPEQKEEPELITAEPILPPEPEKPWPKEEPQAPKNSDMPPQTLVHDLPKAVLPSEDYATTPDTAPVPEKPEPQVPQAAPAEPSQPVEKSGDDQSLESQNIFHMLGIEDAKDEEKEQFLDELQQIIWEDFLDNDVDLLLTEEEKVDFKKIQDNTAMNEEDRQTAMVDFLEKLIPDLEKIMLEKALELKEEMFIERIAQLKKDAAEKPPGTTQVDELTKAEQLQKDGKWLDAANILNKIAH